MFENDARAESSKLGSNFYVSMREFYYYYYYYLELTL